MCIEFVDVMRNRKYQTSTETQNIADVRVTTGSAYLVRLKKPSFMPV